MKIILLEDIKGRGKKGQVIRTADGYGNFLLKAGKALLASADNIKALEASRAEAALAESELIARMKAFKETIEAHPLVMKAKASADGALFGSISTKALAEEYERLYGISIDKRRITLPVPIQAIGTFKATIALHRSVTAEGTIKVEAL